jgi:uncharacterized protein YaiI (UPF0178 family)
MEALFKHDFNLAESVIEKLVPCIGWKGSCFVFTNAKIEEVVSLRLIIESVRRTAEYAATSLKWCLTST